MGPLKIIIVLEKYGSAYQLGGEGVEGASPQLLSAPLWSHKPLDADVLIDGTNWGEVDLTSLEGVEQNDLYHVKSALCTLQEFVK